MKGAKPFAFSASMVRGIQNRTKRQTRRLIWPGFFKFRNSSGDRMVQPTPDFLARALEEARDFRLIKPGNLAWKGRAFDYQAPGDWTNWLATIEPEIGQVLYVREGIKRRTDGYTAYTADDDPIIDLKWKWKPSMLPGRYMPATLARTFLTVTDFRVQRLQDISEEDAREEGVGEPYLGDGDPPFEECAEMVSCRKQYRNLWNSLHGPDAQWDANPWIVALTFEVVDREKA